MYKKLILVVSLILITVVIFKITCKKDMEVTEEFKNDSLNDFIKTKVNNIDKLKNIFNNKDVVKKFKDMKKKLNTIMENFNEIEEFIDFNFVMNITDSLKNEPTEETTEEVIEEADNTDDEEVDEEVEGFMDGCGVNCGMV
jgi:hypothetical protein